MKSKIKIEDYVSFEDYLHAVESEEAEIAASPQPVGFNHSFVPVASEQLVRAVLNIHATTGLQCGSIEFGSKTKNTDVCIYVSPNENNTVFWTAGSEPWLLSVSAALHRKILIICVDEGLREELVMCSRYLLVVDNGEVQVQFGDPEPPDGFGKPWVEFTGRERFRSLGEFLAVVSEWYTPVDTYWSFAKWEHFSGASLNGQCSQIQGALKLVFRKNDVRQTNH